MKTTVQSFISDLIPEGTYQAVFLGRKGPVKSIHGGMIFWEFGVEVEGEDKIVAGVSSVAFSTDDRCKAYKWAKIVDPDFTDDSTEWDDANAVGNVVTITVEDYRKDEEVSSRAVEIAPCQDEPSEPA